MAIQYLEHCLPDYFRGHHKTVLQVPVTNKTTGVGLAELIKDEYHMTWDHYTGDYLSEEEKDGKYWPDLSDEELKLALEVLISATEPGIPLFPTVEDEPEDDDDCCYDSVYAFFIWEEEEEEDGRD